MKIVHAILFLTISIFLVRMTAKFRVLTDQHYKSIAYLTFGFTFLYVGPVLFLIILSYSAAGTSNVDKWQVIGSDGNVRNSSVHWTALVRFADWVFMMVMRSDMGPCGFMIAVVIHV